MKFKIGKKTPFSVVITHKEGKGQKRGGHGRDVFDVVHASPIAFLAALLRDSQLDKKMEGGIVGMKVTKKKFVIYYETAGEKAGLCEKILQGVHGPWSFEPRIIYSYESSDRKMSMEDRAALVEKKLKPDAQNGSRFRQIRGGKEET